MLMAFLGPEVRSGARRAVQMTQVQTGERKRTRKLLLQHCSHPLAVLIAAGRILNSCIWISMLCFVPKMEVSDSYESRAKPQNDTDDL